MFSRKKAIGLFLICAVSIAMLSCQQEQTADAGGTPATTVKKIVWKSSGHGPATDPSQIYHDKCCKAITRGIRRTVGG